MARRGYTYSPRCVHDGCTERANYYFDTRREQSEELAAKSLQAPQPLRLWSAPG